MKNAIDVETIQRAITLGSCKIVNIKIQRAGGLQQAVAMHDVCAKAGVPVWGGTMPELGIGRSPDIASCNLEQFRLSDRC